ncbi:WSC-domain-containing protein [Mycena venus]|uniref:WSC-domain-containing protein n=1 Tax=Mycena venus TaxID=2733690 RepID=A0A8H6YCH7_9AGAR|nr:WSC-domain-containing protein [Mycena venus]
MPRGNHFAEYYVDTGAVFSPVGVAANPSMAAVACTTAAVTSFLPTRSSSTTTASTASTSSSVPVSSTPIASTANGWYTAIPCATDTPSRVLADAYITSSNTNTPLSYTQQCFSLGFTYAAVEYGDECYCGAGLVSNVSTANISDCDIMQVYNTTHTPPANVAPSGWTPYGTTGCSQDSASRVFTNGVSAGDALASPNTPAACMAHCANLGYSMSGVEYGPECYCGNAWKNGTPLPGIFCYYATYCALLHRGRNIPFALRYPAQFNVSPGKRTCQILIQSWTRQFSWGPVHQV